VSGEEMNGSSPASGSGLAEAVRRHQQALVKVNTRPDGAVEVNVGQLFLDLALAEVRIEVLFEILRDELGVAPATLMRRMRDLLLKNAKELEDLTRPQIAIASGRVPRNG
jgi:hypothetical protein